MQHDIFSCLQSFLLANVSPLSISFSLLPLHKRIHKLFIDIPEVSFTFLWRIWIYFYPTLSYAPVCFSKIIVSTRYAVPGKNIRYIYQNVKRMIKVNVQVHWQLLHSIRNKEKGSYLNQGVLITFGTYAEWEVTLIMYVCVLRGTDGSKFRKSSRTY